VSDTERDPERRPKEISAAVIGLAGVLIGAAIGTGTSYLLALRAEQFEMTKLERAQHLETRVAARLVMEQLATIAAQASILADNNDVGNKDLPLPFDL
jgi:hypothetical protein